MDVSSFQVGPHVARNYLPLPVAIERGEGVWLWDEHGNKYLDMLGAYSAVSFGHCHPRLIDAMTRQARRLDTISRALHCRVLEQFLERACEITGYDVALPMNSGAEAVETALKAARRWAYEVKGVTPDKAEIICCDGNFHGRTIAVTAMSTVPAYCAGFGPFPPGFKSIPFDDADALEKAITPNTAAFLVEPIQGEGGIIVPFDGFLTRALEVCREANVLLIADEIQSGLGRTGKLLASWHEDVKPDAVTLGKALGGGLLPVSLFLARADVMDVLRPGEHGSTFGGNPIAAAVGYEALGLLTRENLSDRAATLGPEFMERLRQLRGPIITDVRGRGLFVGVELDPTRAKASDFVLTLMEHNLLAKETHRNTVRLAPPLVVEQQELEWGLDKISKSLDQYT